MKIAIISVPHTGTHFLADLFGYSRHVKLTDVIKTKSGNEIRCDHTYNPSSFENRIEEGYTVVTPMRHPISTMRTWCRWKREWDEDYGSDNPQHIYPEKVDLNLVQPNKLIQHYQNLIMVADSLDINFLPVDSDNREEYLRKFNKKFRLKLKTNWRPRNTLGPYEQDIEEPYKSLITNLMNCNKKFFSKFNYS